MRIPVRAQLNGFTPALDPFSEDKLIWVKIDTKDGEIGIPSKIAMVAMIISAMVGTFWSRGLRGTQSDINVYRDLGHDRFILLFIISAIVGIFAYVWGLYVYDFKKTKKYPLSKSLELYKKTPKHSKEQRAQIKKAQQREIPVWLATLAILASIILFGFGFLSLFITSKDWSLSGGLFGWFLVFSVYAVYQILYSTTAFFSRRYLNRKFNIQFNDKNPAPKTKTVSK